MYPPRFSRFLCIVKARRKRTWLDMPLIHQEEDLGQTNQSEYYQQTVLQDCGRETAEGSWKFSQEHEKDKYYFLSDYFRLWHRVLSGYLVVSALIRKSKIFAFWDSGIFVFLTMSHTRRCKTFEDPTPGSRDITILAVMCRLDIGLILERKNEFCTIFFQRLHSSNIIEMFDLFVLFC